MLTFFSPGRIDLRVLCCNVINLLLLMRFTGESGKFLFPLNCQNSAGLADGALVGDFWLAGNSFLFCLCF
jgi:hypothetical protein